MASSDEGSWQSASGGRQPFQYWNRVVAFLGPIIAIASGAGATWLIQHLPGLHLDRKAVAGEITSGLTFLVGAAGTFAMHHKWLSGWQRWEQSLNDIAALGDPGLIPGGTYEPGEYPPGDTPPGNFPPALPAVPALPGLGTPPRPGQTNGTSPAPGEARLTALGEDARRAAPGEDEMVLPADEEEMTDAPPRPESAVTPDPPIDELALARE